MPPHYSAETIASNSPGKPGWGHWRGVEYGWGLGVSDNFGAFLFTNYKQGHPSFRFYLTQGWQHCQNQWLTAPEGHKLHLEGQTHESHMISHALGSKWCFLVIKFILVPSVFSSNIKHHFYFSLQLKTTIMMHLHKSHTKNRGSLRILDYVRSFLIAYVKTQHLKPCNELLVEGIIAIP